MQSNPPPDVPRYPEPGRRVLIAGSALLAVMLTTLDSTIAVVALPRMQSTLGASQEQIAWVLTSYLIAAAIATPLSGWLADRFGRTRVMSIAVLVFTLSSLGCGMAPSLELLVLFRFIQGASGAGLVPLSQVLLLDIYPPEKHGPATAMFGIGTLLGPMLGPTLGGWLTESFTWRWIFLINAPIGLAATAGLFLFGLKDVRHAHAPFDVRGFAFIATALTSFQLMLDRGQLLDWFSSTEICIEAGVAGLSAYLAIVHLLSVPHPFIRPAIFKDRNFLIGSFLTALIGIFLVGLIPLVTNLMQGLLGYPVLLTGMLSMPRAVGNVVTVTVAGRLAGKIDSRLLLMSGFSLLLASMWVLTQVSLDTGQFTMALNSFLQGCGSGLIFLPLMLLVFTTLPPEFRNEGATLYALTRNLGGAAGISLIQAMTIRDTATLQSHMVERLRPDNPIVALRLPDFDSGLPAQMAGLIGQVTRQAAMAAYVDTFRTLFVLAALLTPACLLMKTGKKAQTGEPLPSVHID